MKLLDYIAQVSVMSDDFCKIYYPARKSLAGGTLPELAHSEVIIMKLIGEYPRLRTDGAIYHHFAGHWEHLFPNLTDRSNFVR